MEKISNFSGTPPECVSRPYFGEDGKLCFLEHLHHHYYHEVVEKRHSYDLFVDSFLYSHKHHNSDDPAEKNGHHRNLVIIRYMLTKRRDLVEKHFSTPFPLQDYNIVWSDLKYEPQDCNCTLTHNSFDNANDSEFVNLKAMPQSDCQQVHAPFGCRFSTEVLDILVRGINRADIFVRQIDIETLRSLLVGTLDKPLVVKYARRLSYLFHALKKEGWICRNWQKNIENSKNIYKRDGVTLILARDLSPALYSVTAEKKKFHYQNLIDEMIRRINKYYSI